MPLLDFPTNPTSGQTYAAPNGVTYKFDTSVGPVGVWVTAAPAAALSVTAGSISGATSLGSVLTYTQGVASGGTSPYTYTQQWYRDGAIIGGATGTSYTIVAADQGKALTVTITATDSAATPATATATTTPFNVPGVGALSISSAGTITGTASSGSTLTYATGTATGGTAPYTYTWVWKRAPDNAVLATNTPTYVLTAAEVGKNVYVELTATDSTTPTALTATASTANYPASPATVTASPFPNLTLSPAGAPNASPAATNFGSYQGLGSVNWNAANPSPTSLTSTGALRFQVNGTGGFTSGATPITTGQLLEVIWDPTTIDATADGTTLNAVIKDGTYETPFSITVDKNPTYSIPTNTGAAASTTISIPPQTPQSFNAPIKFYHTPPLTDPLTNVKVKINGAALAVTLQNTPAGALTLNPGDSVELFADMGTTVGNTYSTTINMGVFTGTWAQTATTAPYITAPSVTVPATPLNPSLNSPAGITLQGSTYDPQAGAGSPQTGSTWEVYENGLPSTVQTTNTISAVTAPALPAIGTVYGGGYFAGQINDGGIYNIIVAPVEGDTSGPATGGTLKGQYGGTTSLGITWKTSSTPETGGNIALSQNLAYGKPWTDAAGALGATYPLFDWCKNSPLGPNGGGGIGGFTDWYIPAKNELEVLYYFLKPEVAAGVYANNTSSGSNPNAVAPEPVSTNYTSSNPAQTTSILFQGSNAQAFNTSGFYWSSSEDSGSTSGVLVQWPRAGAQSTRNKSNTEYARAIRRVATTGVGSTQVLSITGADTDGFKVGMYIKGTSSTATGIITAIDGTSVTITQTSATNWNNTDKIKGDGTALAGTPYAGVTGALETAFIPKADLTPSTNLWARAQYSTSNPSAATSAYGNWAGPIQMASSFAIAPGTPMQGGYYAGQIQVPATTGTIYNLIVAPVGPITQGGNTLYGQKGGSTPTTIQWKTSATAETVNVAAAQDEAYGKTWTDYAGAGGVNGLGGAYPLFGWCISDPAGPNNGTSTPGTGIGGYNDWYIPAKNELAVLYFFLKPDTTPNNTGNGSNQNSLPPYFPNTNYGPNFPDPTAAADFISGSGGQAFTPANAYYSSTENSITPSFAWRQTFGSGFLSNDLGKNNNFYARAVRRVPA